MKSYQQYINEKINDDYSDWKKYQLFYIDYKRFDDTCTQICITTKHIDIFTKIQEIRKIYEYDTYKNNIDKNKIIKVEAFYFSPNINDTRIIYQSDNFEDIYQKFNQVIKEIEIYDNAKKYNI